MAFPYETDSTVDKNGQTFGFSKTIENLIEGTTFITPSVYYDKSQAFCYSKGDYGKTTVKLFAYVSDYPFEVYEVVSKETLITKYPYNYIVKSTDGQYGRNFENITPNMQTGGLPKATDYINTKFMTQFNYKSLINCLGVVIVQTNHIPFTDPWNTTPQGVNPVKWVRRIISLKNFYDTYLGGDYTKKISDVDSITLADVEYVPFALVTVFNSVGSSTCTEEGVVKFGGGEELIVSTSFGSEEEQIDNTSFRQISKIKRNYTGIGDDNYDWNNPFIAEGSTQISQCLCGVPAPPPVRSGYEHEIFAHSSRRDYYLINERYTHKVKYRVENKDKYSDQEDISFRYALDLTFDDCIRLGCTKGLTVCTTFNTVDKISYLNGVPTSNIYIPKIDNSGGCNGDYYTRKNYTEAPQTNWTDNNYYNNITVSDDHNTYIEKIELNEPTLNQYEKFNTYYILTGQQLTQLQDYLWNADESIFAEIVKGLGLFGENPMNFILSLRQYPIKLDEIANADTAEITIGRNIQTGVTAKTIHNMNSVIDLGSCEFPKYFGDTFLSYSPYTNAKLYIPYCNEIDIPTADFVGHTINIKLAIDFITGVCRGIVFCDDVIYTYTDGNIGETISVTGDNASNVANNYIASVTNTLGSVASKNVMGTVSGVQNILTAGATEVKTSGASSPNINLWLPQYCYFLVKMPQELLNDYTHYAHTTGFACDFYDDLINLQGYTVCADVDINLDTTEAYSLSATDAEKTMLKNMLENGVYL